jgi:hypothetical protein
VALAYFLLRVGVVVAFVEAQVLRSPGSTRCVKRHRIECFAHHPLVVNVCPGQRHGDRNTASIRQYVALGAALGPIGRVGTGLVPPLGALTIALSSDDQVQSMPRFSS